MSSEGRSAPGGTAETRSYSTRLLLVFAKAPRPGRVKTRLARTLGAGQAAEIYRKLGRKVVDQVRGGGYRTVVVFDPPEAEKEIRAWLEAGDLELLEQRGETLGERLSLAFDWGFRRSRIVCVIGTDAPGVHRERIEHAFSLLEDPTGPDAAYGPATDGGYYLLALRRPAPELLRGIPWSTNQVLARSLDRARAHGIKVALLPFLSDVDRAEDLPADFGHDP